MTEGAGPGSADLRGTVEQSTGGGARDFLGTARVAAVQFCVMAGGKFEETISYPAALLAGASAAVSHICGRPLEAVLGDLSAQMVGNIKHCVQGIIKR